MNGMIWLAMPETIVEFDELRSDDPCRGFLKDRFDRFRNSF